MFRIGDFSRLARVTIKTLRHYDEEGLLTPAHVDHSSGYRYYTAAQLETLQRIVLLKDLGFALEEIRTILSVGFDSPLLAERLDVKRAELLTRIEADQARLRRLNALRSVVSETDLSPAPAVTLRTIPAVAAYTHRARVASLGEPVEAMFEAAEAAVARVRARADASPFLIFHDPEHRTTDVEVEVCIPLKPGAEGLIASRVVEGGAVGCATYKGPYEKTPVLYEAMLHWIERSGLALAGSLREVYHRYGADQRGYRLPGRVLASSSDDYVTELQAPVCPRPVGRGDRS